MNIARMFASAFVRRIAYVLAAAALAWVGIGQARADEYCTSTTSTATCDNAQQAQANALNYTNQFDASGNGSDWKKTICGPFDQGNNVYAYVGAWRPNNGACGGSQQFVTVRFFSPPGDCATRPPLGDLSMQVATENQTDWPIEVCKDQCVYLDNHGTPGAPNTYTWWKIDNQIYVSITGWEPTGATCVTDTNDLEPPPPDQDSDGCSDSQDAFPANPNECKDSDGDGTGDNADHAPDDPDDGKDGEGEEDGDDEGDNEAHGGGDCTAPPTCTGDGIACASLHTQWKIMCKGATVTGNPEVCLASYTCTGDVAQCKEIALLRATACNTEKWKGGEGSNELAEELLNGLKGGPTANEPASGSPGNPGMGIWADQSDDEAEADDNGYGLARSCPPPVTIFGRTIPMPCDLGMIIGALVLLAGFVQFAYAFTKD